MIIPRCDIAYKVVEDIVFNEECSVDVQHLCEEHINIPVVHHHDSVPHYGPPPSLPEPEYGPPPPKPHYGPPAAPESHYGPPSAPESLYGPPSTPEPPYGPIPPHGPFKDNPHPDSLYFPPEVPKPIFSFPKPDHHDPHAHYPDKSQKLSVHDFASIYKTSFSQHSRRIRRQVAGEAESIAIFPQLGGQVLSEENSNFLSTQETQLSNIVKVYKS